jgi:hypothetical protein
MPGGSTVLAASNVDQIATRLRDISRDGGSIEAAQVRVIGLDEIRIAAGPRWERIRERVRTGSLEILSRHTGPDDVVVPAGDGFLIILAEAPPGMVQQRCQEMRDALVRFYLGDEALTSLRAEVKNRVLTPDGLTDLIAGSTRHDAKAQRNVVAKSHQDEIACAPVLVTHEERVGAVLAAPVAHGRSGKRIAYNPDFILDGRHHTQHDYLELDIAVLDRALHAATLLKESGHARAVGVTVHASTMQLRRAREIYLGWMAETDPAVRRTLFVMISEIERGTPLLSISDWCAGLRAFASMVWLDFHLTDHAIASVGGTGAWGAGFNLPIFAGAQKAPRVARLSDQISFWSRSLSQQGLHLIVHGFQEPGFLAMAGPLGVDLATGDATHPFAFSDDEVRALPHGRLADAPAV